MNLHEWYNILKPGIAWAIIRYQKTASVVLIPHMHEELCCRIVGLPLSCRPVQLPKGLAGGQDSRGLVGCCFSGLARSMPGPGQKVSRLEKSRKLFVKLQNAWPSTNYLSRHTDAHLHAACTLAPTPTSTCLDCCVLLGGSSTVI